MEIKEQPKLLFKGVDFISVNYNSFGKRDGDLDVNFSASPKVFHPEGEPNIFKIILDVNASVEGFFNIELRAIGHFEITSEINQVIKSTMINANAPAIVFPYVRAFLSSFTANLGNGIGAITIPTQFFKGKLDVTSVISEE